MINNKKLVFCGITVCVICAMATTVGVMKDAVKTTSGEIEYVNDDASEVLPHDGEILVDSLRLTKISGSDEESNEDSKEGSEALSTAVVSDDASDLENADTYFEEVRATVNLDRNQIISMLSDVIAEAESEGEKENATAKKLEIIEYMNKEKHIENIIQTKGLPECLVLISENAVNVTVNKQDLAQSDVAKICDIVMRETGRDAGQILIQSKF